MRTKVGLMMIGLALVGFLATLVVHPLLQRPGPTEDLTRAWQKAGPTALGASSTVAVPPGDTLVAFLVGTELLGLSGTTTGTCTATSAGRTLRLGSPVQIERSLTGILQPGQETVAIAGWKNDGPAEVSVEITCRSGDSTVDHFVAVPTDTGTIDRRPWFQPWLWISLAVAGLALALSKLFTPTSR